PLPLTASGRDVPPSLERIVLHCLDKRPAERFHAARDVAFALEQVGGSTSAAHPAGKAPRRRRWTALAIVVLVAGAAAALGFAAGRTERVRPLAYQRLTFQDGLVGRASFLPGGRAVAYSLGHSGDPDDVLVTEPGALQPRRLGLLGHALA